jgi:NADH-quinone oxidoreductase subunit C
MTVVDLSTQLGERFPQVRERSSGDCPAFDVPAAELEAVLRFLRDDGGFDLLADVSGIDWGVDQSPRFGVAYHLLSTGSAGYVRIVSNCLGGEEPTIPTASQIWPGADWHEREAFDMFGIRFNGHPDMRRILMWDEYPHFPLRKDFPLAGIETELPDDEVAAETKEKVRPAPMAGGPFVAPQESHMSQREPRARDESWNEKKPKP